MSRFPSVYTGPVNQRGEINTTKVKDLSSFIIKKGTIEEALPAEVKCCACSFGCSRTGGVDMVQYSLEGTNNKTGYSLLPLTTDILKTALKWLPDQKYKDEGYRVHTVCVCNLATGSLKSYQRMAVLFRNLSSCC